MAGTEHVFEEVKAHRYEAAMLQIRAPCPLQPLHQPLAAAPIKGAIPAPLPLTAYGPSCVSTASSAAVEMPAAQNPVEVTTKRKTREKNNQKVHRQKRRRMREGSEGTPEVQTSEIERHKLVLENRQRKRKRVTDDGGGAGGNESDNESDGDGGNEVEGGE